MNSPISNLSTVTGSNQHSL